LIDVGRPGMRVITVHPLTVQLDAKFMHV